MTFQVTTPPRPHLHQQRGGLHLVPDFFNLIFGELDVDGDGRITSQDVVKYGLSNGISRSSEHLQTMFAEIDTKEDGEWDEEECRNGASVVPFKPHRNLFLKLLEKAAPKNRPFFTNDSQTVNASLVQTVSPNIRSRMEQTFNRNPTKQSEKGEKEIHIGFYQKKLFEAMQSDMSELGGVMGNGTESISAYDGSSVYQRSGLQSANSRHSSRRPNDNSGEQGRKQAMSHSPTKSSLSYARFSRAGIPQPDGNNLFPVMEGRDASAVAEYMEDYEPSAPATSRKARASIKMLTRERTKQKKPAPKPSAYQPLPKLVMRDNEQKVREAEKTLHGGKPFDIRKKAPIRDAMALKIEALQSADHTPSDMFLFRGEELFLGEGEAPPRKRRWFDGDEGERTPQRVTREEAKALAFEASKRRSGFVVAKKEGEYFSVLESDKELFEKKEKEAQERRRQTRERTMRLPTRERSMNQMEVTGLPPAFRETDNSGELGFTQTMQRTITVPQADGQDERIQTLKMALPNLFADVKTEPERPEVDHSPIVEYLGETRPRRRQFKRPEVLFDGDPLENKRRLEEEHNRRLHKGEYNREVALGLKTMRSVSATRRVQRSRKKDREDEVDSLDSDSMSDVDVPAALKYDETAARSFSQAPPRPEWKKSFKKALITEQLASQEPYPFLEKDPFPADTAYIAKLNRKQDELDRKVYSDKFNRPEFTTAFRVLRPSDKFDCLGEQIPYHSD